MEGRIIGGGAGVVTGSTFVGGGLNLLELEELEFSRGYKRTDSARRGRRNDTRGGHERVCAVGARASMALGGDVRKQALIGTGRGI